jgi:adenylate kinase family enzyme
VVYLFRVSSPRRREDRLWTRVRGTSAFAGPPSVHAALELRWRRVLIVGSAGAGKTTFATTFARLAGLPIVHLDSEYWRPGWVATPPDEWAARIDELIARDEWVMDGNYGATLDRRLERADAVVFLDVGRVRCLARVILRVLRNHGRTGPGLPAGCPERLDPQFLAWVWNYPRRSRGRVLRLLAASGLPVVHLRSQRAADAWLDG